MKRLSVFASGSRGDVQPLAALAYGLQKTGFEVRFVAPEAYRSLVTDPAVEFRDLGGADPRAVMANELQNYSPGRVGSLVRFLSRGLKGDDPFLDRLLNAFKGTDAVVCSASAGMAFHIAESLKIPCMGAFINPYRRTRSIPPPFGPLEFQRAKWPSVVNWLTHAVIETLFWRFQAGQVNRGRENRLGLTAMDWFGPAWSKRFRAIPIAFGFSSAVIPQPRDWPAWYPVTGYWFWDPPGWQPPAQLVDFLEGDTPPLFIGFGSTVIHDREFWTKVVFPALQMTESRAVLGAGWSMFDGIKLPSNVLPIESAPYGWLFQKVTAVVHHGGTGTNADALRSGVPSINIPFFGEQGFWASRMARIGVAPSPVRGRKLTAHKLAAMIERVRKDQNMRLRARRIGEFVRAENGTVRASEFLSQALRSGAGVH